MADYVTTSRGVVTLEEGAVQLCSEKAIRLAGETGSVRDVEDRLTIVE